MASVDQRRDANVLSPTLLDQTEGCLRAGQRGRRLGRNSLHRFLLGLLILAATLSIRMVVFGLDMIFQATNISTRIKHRSGGLNTATTYMNTTIYRSNRPFIPSLLAFQVVKRRDQESYSHHFPPSTMKIAGLFFC